MPHAATFHKLAMIVISLSATGSLASGATVTWTQTGLSTATSSGTPDDNMNWLIGANWSTASIPTASDQIYFNDVTTDTSALSGINGRYVSFVNTNFLGTSESSLTLTQTTSGRANIVGIIQNGTYDNHLTFSIGQVSISAGAQLTYNGQVSTVTSTGQDQRNLYLGEGQQTVTNAGTLSLSYQGNSNDRIVRGSLKIADGSTFNNSGTFTLSAASNGQYIGSTRLNALIGATTNSGAITINRSGDSTGDLSSYDVVRGGIEFASLNNATTASTFTMTVNNATLLGTIDGLDANPALADRAATLVIAGALQNSGTVTLNRTPLTSGAGGRNSATDATSRIFDVKIGTLNNAATGAFIVNHTNSSTPLTTTTSTVDIVVTGAASNAGLLSLKGTGVTGTAGEIITRLQTQGGFSNTNGGIITVAGKAILINTGEFSNTNTQTSRTIQGSARTWDTSGLTIDSSTTTDASFEWATGIHFDGNLVSGSDGSFSNANFTIGDLILNSGAAAYTLTGGGDLFIAGNFSLTGTLNLGDWLSVTTDGAQGQTLIFDDVSLRSQIDALIASGNITATLAAGYSLATFTNGTDDAFYIGTIAAIPEPASLLLMGAGAMCIRRRRII